MNRRNFFNKLDKRVTFFILVCISMVVTASAQEKLIRVNGIVTDNFGPLPGVSVFVEGNSRIGTITNNAGEYSLNVPVESKSLVFRFIGKETVVVPVNGNTPINVELLDASVKLDEVVAIGYGFQKKSDLTGSVGKVNMKEIATSAEMNIVKAIQGKVSGIKITGNSGSPGSGITVRIRGTGTVNNSDPLYIVDDQPVNGIDFLNPGDIANIEILKDASAVAIYGSKAANGVVLITTKKGKIGKAIVTFDAYKGFQTYINKPDLAGAREYAILDNEGRINAGSTIEYDFQNPDTLGRGTDWWESSFRNASIQNYNLSITGGSEKMTMALIANIFDQEGIIKKTDFKRRTLRFNADYRLSDKIKIGENIAINNTKRHWVNEFEEIDSHVSYILRMDPVTAVYNPDGTYAQSKFSKVWHPAADLDFNTNREWNLLRIVSNTTIDIDLSKNLKYKASYSFDQSRHDTYSFYPYYNIGPLFHATTAFLVKNYEKYNTWNFFNTLTYLQTTKKHSYNGMIGLQAENTKHEMFGASKRGESNEPSLRYFDAYSGSATAFGFASDQSLLSYFGRFFYSYDNKYMFTGTYRMDGSSKFSPRYRFGHFPSASAAWTLSNENFMKQVDWIDQLKLRLGWGMIGNQNIPNYAFATLINAGQGYVLGTSQSIVAGKAPNIIGNDILKWETTIQYNAGVDFVLFKNKVTATVELYNRKTNDMLLQVPIAGISGVAPPFSNAGNVENKGVEVQISYREQSGNVSFDNSINLSANRNKVTSLGGGEPINGAFHRDLGFISRTEVGHSIAEFYGWSTDGIFQNQQEVDNYRNNDGNLIQPAAAPGDFRYKDLNSDGVINEKDKTFIGSPHPLFTGGYSFEIGYAGFDINAGLEAVIGNKIFNSMNRYLMTGMGEYNSSMDYFNGYWRGEGTSNTIPRVIETDPNQNWRISDRYVEDGSYLRFKNIEIGYALPEKLAQRLHLSKCRIYLSAQNLFTLTNYSGIDPEIGTGRFGTLDIGIDRATYPYAKFYLLGTSITF